MPKNLPKVHPSHSNDEKATRYLRSIFPEQWQFVPQRDMDSGIEYGQDISVLITDDNNNITGAEFRVQNKATKQIHKNKITVLVFPQ